MAKFICKNCNQRFDRAVIAATRLSDRDIKVCPFCGSLFTELVPETEIRLPGLKKATELFNGLFDKPKPPLDDNFKRAADKVKERESHVQDFTIEVIGPGLRIRHKYERADAKPEQYIEPSCLGEAFRSVGWPDDGGNWESVHFPTLGTKIRIIRGNVGIYHRLMIEDAVNIDTTITAPLKNKKPKAKKASENIHRIPEGI